MAEQRFCKPQVDSLSDVNTDVYSSPSAAPAYNPDSCNGNPSCDADLRRVVDAWPDLTEPIRRAVLTLVDALTITDTPAHASESRGFGDDSVGTEDCERIGDGTDGGR